jgi:hypothetical protein
MQSTLRTIFNSLSVVAGELLYCMQAPVRVSACYYKDTFLVIMYHLRVYKQIDNLRLTSVHRDKTCLTNMKEVKQQSLLLR